MQRDITVGLVEMDNDNTEPCDFCSTPEHATVMERGIVTADYRLENTYGVTMGFSCGMCLEADMRPVGDEDLGESSGDYEKPGSAPPDVENNRIS